MVSPFLCSDDSKADNESEPNEQRPERHESLTVHDALVSRWSDRVTSRPSLPLGSLSHDTLAPSSQFPLAPVALLRIRQRPAILRVGPFPARRLAWRRVSHRSLDRHSSLDFTSDSSSSSSSSDSLSDISLGSSSGSLSDSSSVHSSTCDASGQSHSGPSTRVAPPRSIASTHVDLLPPGKRFKDLYSFEASREEHMETGTANAEADIDLGVGDRAG
ncbi:hypothetical protein Tco_0100956, partial [Tanacetum coccineum]